MKHLSEKQVSDLAYALGCISSGQSSLDLMKRANTEHTRHVSGCAACQKRVLLAVCLFEAISEIPVDEIAGCTDEEVMNALVQGAIGKFAGIIAGA